MILQFGAGNFLRGFVDLFADELGIGPIVVVQSTGRERADAINHAGGRYHVAVQGYAEGKVVDETVEVRSISEALHAGSQWDRVLKTASDPSLTIIISNTTEAGLALDPLDQERPPGAPESFPAKLLVALEARYQSGLAGPWIVPCELLADNGVRLRSLVLEQAAMWNVSLEVCDWIEHSCRWVNTLVDRIVPGRPKAHPLLETDPLLISAEPFAFWAVETTASDFPFRDHPAVTVASDISSYTLRKVRILNGAHTALVCRGQDLGVATVRECLEHPVIAPWIEQFLFTEIVPVLEGRCDDPEGFAKATLDRFRNPFLDHQLSAIALNHQAKMKVRLEPTFIEYQEKFGVSAPILSAILGK